MKEIEKGEPAYKIGDIVTVWPKNDPYVIEDIHWDTILCCWHYGLKGRTFRRPEYEILPYHNK